MIPPAEAAADGLERFLRQLLGKVHRHLPRVGNLHGAALGKDRIHIHGVIIGDDLLDQLHRDLAVFIAGDDVLERGVREVRVERALCELCVGAHARERPFQLADVGIDLLRDVGKDGFVHVDVLFHCLLFEDGDARFQIRRLHVRDEPALKAGAQALLKRGQLHGRPVGTQDDLLAGGVQRVEGVEEFLLRALAA